MHGPTWTNIGYLDTLAAARNHPNYQIPLGPNQGRGIACGFWFNVGGESTARAHTNEDGSVTAATGSPDIGGSRASIGMMVAEVLGIPAFASALRWPTRPPSASLTSPAARV